MRLGFRDWGLRLVVFSRFGFRVSGFRGLGELRFGWGLGGQGLGCDRGCAKDLA